jgi:DtxR family Mn-dependent transcriptional regulator
MAVNGTEAKAMQPAQEKLPEAMAEILEAIWAQEEAGNASFDAFGSGRAGVNDELLQELRRNDLIAVESGGRVKLLPPGRKLAEMIIRRHRLAERLICDVLGSHVDESEDAACEFEHLLAEGITSSICTLLGHPRYCPHNRPIPEGDCCRQAREELKPIVVTCDQLEIGESARIAYLCTHEHTLLMKLSNLGISPGASIRLLQRWPSYVIQCDETEIAIEEKVARNIYVWHAG